MRYKILILGLIVLVCTGLIACTSPSFQPDSQGWVLLRYTTDQDKGIQGVEPVDLGEEIILAQEVFPGDLEALKTATLETTDLQELPPAIGTYRGAQLTWELYRFEAEIADVGPFPVTVNLGLAAGESASYFVGLVSLPETYASDTAKIDTIFYHALYAFSPLR